MRRSLTLPALLAVVALAGAACASTPAPGWTYAPPTSPPPSQPAASGSAAPASEAPSGGGGIGAVQISAVNVQFDPTTVSAPAGVAFVIHFDNKDAGQPHNVDIKDASGGDVFKGDLVTGPGQVDYQVPALAAGTYPFVCTVHANMKGTITAG